MPLFLGGDEGVETHLLRRDSFPVGVGHAVLGLGATVAYFLKIMVVLSQVWGASAAPGTVGF